MHIRSSLLLLERCKVWLGHQDRPMVYCLFRCLSDSGAVILFHQVPGAVQRTKNTPHLHTICIERGYRGSIHPL